MKKKALSLALAFALCLGLTVPAFASGGFSGTGEGGGGDGIHIAYLTLEDVTFSVNPISVVTIQFVRENGSDSSPFTAYMFDKPVSVSMKDGRIFTMDVYYQWVNEYGLMDDIRNQDLDSAVFLGADYHFYNLWTFSFIIDNVDGSSTWYNSPYMVSKSYVDSLIEEGHKVDIQPYTAAQPNQPTATSFSDVKADAFYAKPVAWAVEKGVTAGTSATTFSPNATCTQGQILTFLWRAKGEPKPTGTVSGTQYYATAVQWAKEQGLTDNFSAEADCTRSMVVTYLWKLAGSPKTGTSNFSDVSANADYAQAVAWAVEQGVTSGTSATTFSPDATCTRGQIVTFLYRALAK